MKTEKISKLIGLLAVTALFITANVAAAEKQGNNTPSAAPGQIDINAKVIQLGDSDGITHLDLYRELLRVNGDVVLEKMTQDKIIELEARKRGISVEAQDIADRLDAIKAKFKDDANFREYLKKRKLTVDMLNRQIKIEILKDRMMKKDEDIEVSKKEVQQFFEENKKRYAKPETIKISHILVETPEEAEDIVMSLEAGADFGKLAEMKSIDKVTADKEGLLGVYRLGVLNKTLEQALFALGENEISQPIQTDLGWHVFKVLEKTDMEEAKLDKDMKEAIKKGLEAKKESEAYPKWIKKISEHWIVNKK